MCTVKVSGVKIVVLRWENNYIIPILFTATLSLHQQADSLCQTPEALQEKTNTWTLTGFHALLHSVHVKQATVHY